MVSDIFSFEYKRFYKEEKRAVLYGVNVYKELLSLICHDIAWII